MGRGRPAHPMDWTERWRGGIRLHAERPVDNRSESERVFSYDAFARKHQRRPVTILPRAVELRLLFVVAEPKPGTSVPGSFLHAREMTNRSADEIEKITESGDVQGRIGLIKVAEGEGFEPPVALRLRLISSQVPSTTQPPFQPDQFSRGGDPFSCAHRDEHILGQAALQGQGLECAGLECADVFSACDY